MVRVLALWLALLAAPALAQTPLPAEAARLELILDPVEGPLREGQMLLATLRGEYRVRIALEDLPIPHSADFDWIQLARDDWTLEQVDGLPTQVMRRRLALFPQSAGALSFPALTHQLTIFTPDGGRSTHPVTSAPVTIQVSPALGEPWWPVRAVEFSESWSRDPAGLPLGETVRRRVILRALGATDQMMPPQPALRAPWLISFSRPPERSTELTPAGPVTTVVWEWSLRPKTGERGVLPAIRIPYYDTGAQRAGEVVLPAVPLAYAAAAGEGAQEPWRAAFTGWAYPLAGGAAGLVAGAVLPMLLFGRNRRLKSRAELRAQLARLLPDPAKRRLSRAARRGDGHALRWAARSLAQEMPPGRRDRVLAEIDALDRALFAEEPGPKPDLRRLARKLRKL
ncbi:BatD family protein [Poseidonocella sedimentorum]|uniref:Oxygen tolerance n=1 Tax=Poseidonocella sedimentorum TaxID=871652 RepID=A0A1I6E3I5_9RHOB|nr:BatD family protein [Poseidonocella sedimentorum]SFR12319.1 Oxygen tolerance [Poseidonocella sedimentorum]